MAAADVQKNVGGFLLSKSRHVRHVVGRNHVTVCEVNRIRTEVTVWRLSMVVPSSSVDSRKSLTFMIMMMMIMKTCRARICPCCNSMLIVLSKKQKNKSHLSTLSFYKKPVVWDRYFFLSFLFSFLFLFVCLSALSF